MLEFLRAAIAAGGGQPEALGAVSSVTSGGEAARGVGEADSHELHARGVFCDHSVQVYERGGRQSVWPVPHSAGGGYGVLFGR